MISSPMRRTDAVGSEFIYRWVITLLITVHDVNAPAVGCHPEIVDHEGMSVRSPPYNEASLIGFSQMKMSCSKPRNGLAERVARLSRVVGAFEHP